MSFEENLISLKFPPSYLLGVMKSDITLNLKHTVKMRMEMNIKDRTVLDISRDQEQVTALYTEKSNALNVLQSH